MIPSHAPLTSGDLAERSRRALPWSSEATAHILVLCAIVASQVIFAPVHSPSTDATWHYRLACDMAQGRDIWWFGVDANRFFPDLVYTLVGYALSNGARYTTWLFYYYTIQFLVAYAALCGLGHALFEGTRERVTFGLLGIAGLLLLTLVSPFWCGWLLEPGGHGTGLSACLALLALALWINRSQNLDGLALLAFVLGAALLTASNRFLLVGFFLPLIVALTAVLVCRRFVGSSEDRTAPTLRAAPVALIGATALGVAAGLAAWQLLGASSWYRMVAGGSFPDLPTVSNLGAWIAARTDKEVSELMRDDGEIGQVRPAVAFLFAVVSLSAFEAVRLALRRGRSHLDENRLIFAVFTAACVLCGLFFVLVVAVESGLYHYRYLAIPFGLAIAWVCVLFAGLGRGLGRLAGPALAGLLAVVVGTAQLRLIERGGQVRSNKDLQVGVRVLEGVLRRRSAARIMRGFGEYWSAHDITHRSRSVNIASVEVDRLRFNLYNNNADELCHDDFFYVLWNARENWPKREAIVAALGEPREIDRLDLFRYENVEVFYYDPKLLQERVVEPSKAAVRRLFPDFECR